MKYRGIQLMAAAAGLLLLAATTLWSQRSSDSSKAFKTCLFPTVDLSTTEEYGEYQSIITNQLRAELRNAGFTIIPREQWDPVREQRGVRPKDLYRGEFALPVARQAGAEMAILSSFSVEDGLMALDIKCYDVLQNVLITGVFKTVRVNLSLYTAIGESAAELMPKITPIGPPPVEQSPVVKEIALLSRDEGMQVYMGDEGLVGSISDGTLLLPPIPFAIGTKVSIEKRKDGYHIGEETVKLNKPEMVVKLKPLRKQTQTATELNWTLGQLLGFGLAQRFYLKPDQTYICAEHYFYVQHAFAGGKPVFHHDLRALFGGYVFSGPHQLLRVNLSTGMGMIVTYLSLPDQPMYADFYWNLVNMALELNFNKYVLYLRSEAKYAMGLGPKNLLGREWIGLTSEGGPTIFTLGVARKW
ncbi:MAG: hypothetical protein JSV89_04885 [Spirochaetaceae bacterium]|nr:MAG: hypothetical protein JSV89_04885 [Spirochaetaceae bacterium]